MSQIRPGDRVVVRSAFGEDLPRRAVTGAVRGHKFDVVWVCDEAEWISAQATGREADADPWPIEAVRIDTGPPQDATILPKTRAG